MANNEESVEDFAFSGSLTLHEIKKILSVQKPPTQIKNRATIEVSQPTRTIYDESPEVNFIIETNLFDTQDFDVSPAFISEYLQNIPQDNHTSDKEPLNFIEQLSDVLQLNNSGAGVKGEQDSAFKSDSSFEDSLIIISDEEKSCEDIHCGADFIPIDIVKSEINSTISSEGEEIDVRNAELNNSLNNSVICIDDDDDEIITINTPLLNYSSKHSDKKSMSLSTNEDYGHTKKNTSFPFASSDTHQNHDENTSSLENINSELSPSVNNSVSPSDKKSFENSESQYGNTFNDTLEEIEMALKYGLNYTMPDDVGENTSENRVSQLKEGNKSIQKTDASSLLTTNYTPCQKKTKDFQFKQPSHKAVPTKSKTPNYKDVVSPVAVYIKNTPTRPILRNVPITNTWQKKTLFHNLETPTISKCNKENVLPEVVYKLPRQVIKTEESPLRLPSNIKKHLPTMPNLTKHKGRVVTKKESPSQIGKKLLCNDLSLNDSKTHFNSTVPLEEVSLHYTKEVYIP